MLNTFLLVIVLSVELYHLSLTLTEGRRQAKPSDASTAKILPSDRPPAALTKASRPL